MENSEKENISQKDMENQEKCTSQLSHQKPPGNTNIRWQLYRWVLTIPAEEYTASQLSQDLDSFCKEYYFQKERGDSGYEHWQVCLSLNTKEYFGTVKNLFSSKAHIEQCIDWPKSKKYCQKEDTRIDGPYSHLRKPLVIIDELRDWQKKVIELIKKEPDPRKIHWYYDEEGGKGKTTLSKYLIYNYNASYVRNAKTADIAYSLKDNPKVVIFDLSRSNEDRINYGAIESVKDGLIFSSKYESKLKIFNSPHVIVFANTEPNLSKLSNDRWDIIEL